ncbi:hypothetical protein PsorP6_009272 [Peronosclerospora sorghi]|uniref:Uncharacterized protein n=1 Tax=Peronosclerospora sorghi TaxID=230839 RepID=A0ACC0W031_9STRA|nr:hypothetical protein PsorP6_009272 [Peronosclerospora sorghi]
MDSVDAALRYLQRQFASVASDEAQWHEERQKLQAKLRELEEQRGEQEQAYKDAMLRVKMLEFALRQERGRYLASPAAVKTTGSSSTKPQSEGAEVSRGVTVTRSVERSNQPSPMPSPAGSPKAHSFYRSDSKIKSASGTPKNAQGKGTEISRPRMMSRTPSGREVEREMNRTASGKDGERELSRAGSGREVEREFKRSTSGSGREVDRVERKANRAVGALISVLALLTIDLLPLCMILKELLKLQSSRGRWSFRLHQRVVGVVFIPRLCFQDGVRALAFHPTEPLLVSGSEDCTVKVWNLSSVANGPPTQRATEMDSVVTMRTHKQSVLAVAVFSSETYFDCPPGRAGAFVSAGRDGILNLFQLPGSDMDKSEPCTYAQYADIKLHSVKDAHEDAIWDLHAHPLSNTLFSAGADGVVRTWEVTSELTLSGELRCPAKTNTNGTGPNVRGSLVPTSVYLMLTDPKTSVVGYTNGSIAQFDYAAERIIQLTRAIDVDTIGRGGQINKLIVHPTMPVAIAAHHDKKIRMYDMRAGETCQMVHSCNDARVCWFAYGTSGLGYISLNRHSGTVYCIWRYGTVDRSSTGNCRLLNLLIRLMRLQAMMVHYVSGQ